MRRGGAPLAVQREGAGVPTALPNPHPVSYPACRHAEQVTLQERELDKLVKKFGAARLAVQRGHGQERLSLELAIKGAELADCVCFPLEMERKGRVSSRGEEAGGGGRVGGWVGEGLSQRLEPMYETRFPPPCSLLGRQVTQARMPQTANLRK
jgi:hypothetical protein